MSFSLPPEQYVVDPEGVIEIINVGSFQVAGRTVSQVEAAIHDQVSKTIGRVFVSIQVKSNSKVAYVIETDAAGQQSVYRAPVPFPLSAENNVGKLLADTYGVMNHLADFKITLHRPSTPFGKSESVLAVIWDPGSGKPYDQTNYPILPGDRLFIDEPLDDDARSLQDVTDNAVEPPPQVKLGDIPPIPPAPSQIEYKLALLEDTSGDLAEFVSYDGPAVVLESAAFQPALRVLKKHGLVKTIGGPRLLVELGRPAEFNLGEEVPNKDRLFRIAQHVKIIGRRAAYQPSDKALSVELVARCDHAGEQHKVETTVTIPPGQSAIARLQAPDGTASPIYIVVTPEWK